MRFSSILTNALALTLLSAATAQQPYDHLFAYGDSLPDNGNLFRLIGSPGEPYFQGRFSNGYVCVEQLNTALGIAPARFHDFAVGGSTTSDVFARQVQPSLAALHGRLPANSLCFYWAGANDLLGLLADPRGNPTLVIGRAMQQTAAALTALHFAGASRIVILNMPNLARTPRVLALADPIAKAGSEALARAYNQALTMTVAQLTTVYGVRATVVDSFALVEDIVADPGRRMFRVVDEPILQPDGSTRHPERQFLFFDDIHPSATGHREIMRTTLLALGLPIPGDANGDQVVNRADVPALTLRLGTDHGPSDLDGNGRVEPADLALLQRMLHGDDLR